jgi:hypothetical protein
MNHNAVTVGEKRVKIAGDDDTRHVLIMELLDTGKGPRFSMTHETYDRRGLDSCGCQVDQVIKLLPQFEMYRKWHGWHLEKHNATIHPTFLDDMRELFGSQLITRLLQEKIATE